jgi:tetratricopeptide (TPR) repeat protein
MVGAFGEVQVMDWGLAKVLPRGGVVDDARAGHVVSETVIATARSGSDVDFSRAGSVLGTPSYMAPEQARGDVERLDERCDVFALGSILCEILTGQPACTGRSSDEIVRKAGRGDLGDAHARLSACGDDTDLVAVARDCLAPEADDRPRDANAVASRITAHLAGVQERLRTAERERAAAEVRVAEQKKRQRVQALLGITFTMLLLLCGGFAWWAQEQKRARLSEAQRTVERAMEDAIARFGQARGAGRDPALWAEARAAALQAREQAEKAGAPAEVRQRIADLVTEIEQHERNRRFVARLLEIYSGGSDRFGYEEYVTRTDAVYREAFRDYGVDLHRLAPEVAAAMLSKLGGEFTVQIAAALDDWFWVRSYKKESRVQGALTLDQIGADDAPAGGDWLFAITRLLDPDPLRTRIRDAVTRQDGKVLKMIADEFDPTTAPPQTVTLLASSLCVPGNEEEAKRLLKKSQPHHVDDFIINENLANISWTDPAEQLPYYMAAVALRPHSAVANSSLGRCLEKLGRPAEAIVAYRRMADADSRMWPTLLGYGNKLDAAGLEQEAIAAYRNGLDVAETDPTSFYTLYGSPVPYKPTRKRPGLSGKVLDGLRAKLAKNPGSVTGWTTLGRVLWSWGEIDEAVDAFCKAVRVPPGDADTPKSFRYDVLGNFLSAGGKHEEAFMAIREALRRSPDEFTYRSLGSALSRQEKYDEAVTAFRESARLMPKSSMNLHILAMSLRQTGRYEEARDTLRRAVQLMDYTPYKKTWEEELALVERQVAVKHRLPAILKGDDRPRDNAERLAVSRTCYDSGRFAASARFAAEAFESDPKLVEGPSNFLRYNAACAASRAGCGRGKDDPAPDPVARAKLRAQALAWLQAELAGERKALEAKDPRTKSSVLQHLNDWQDDINLSGVRDRESLARLPEAERSSWHSFWSEVEALKKVWEKAR